MKMKLDPSSPRGSLRQRRESNEAIKLMLIEYKDKQLIEPTENQKAIAEFERLINELKAMSLI
jgi:hypothetical protein